jgi:hypothetical protein
MLSCSRGWRCSPVPRHRRTRRSCCRVTRWRCHAEPTRDRFWSRPTGPYSRPWRGLAQGASRPSDLHARNAAALTPPDWSPPSGTSPHRRVAHRYRRMFEVDRALLPRTRAGEWCGSCTVRELRHRLLGARLSALAARGMLPVVTVSLGYLILRQVLQLMMLSMRGDRANAVDVLVLRHQVAVLRRQGRRLDLEPADRVALAGLSRLLPRTRWAASSLPRPRCCAGIATWSPAVDLPGPASWPSAGRCRAAGVGAASDPGQPDLGLPAYPG